MPLNWSIEPAEYNSAHRVAVKIKATGERLRAQTQELVQDAVLEGLRIAKRDAPRGKTYEKRGNIRLVDGITATPVTYHPGGTGGGGYWEAHLVADSTVAPQLKWVMEGTGIRADPPRGRITPATGNVMVVQKLGEGPHFIRSAKGQRPQTEWWTRAHARMESVVEDGVNTIVL